MSQCEFRIVGLDETASNRLNAVLEATDRVFMEERLSTDDHLSAEGRVMEVFSEHMCQGWLEGYLLTGRDGFLLTRTGTSIAPAWINLLLEVSTIDQIRMGQSEYALLSNRKTVCNASKAVGSKRIHNADFKARLHRC